MTEGDLIDQFNRGEIKVPYGTEQQIKKSPLYASGANIDGGYYGGYNPSVPNMSLE